MSSAWSHGTSFRCRVTLPAETFLTAKAAFYGPSHPDWGNQSFTTPCVAVVEDCYANVGGEEWLSAATYLGPGFATTQKFIDALCDPTFPDPIQAGVPSLYNELHCNACKNWMNDVWRWQLFAALVIEHLLLLINSKEDEAYNVFKKLPKDVREDAKRVVRDFPIVPQYGDIPFSAHVILAGIPSYDAESMGREWGQEDRLDKKALEKLREKYSLRAHFEGIVRQHGEYEARLCHTLQELRLHRFQR